jgi:surface protein
MFREAKTFNQDIGNWNVGNVNAMTGMLRDAKLFNQDLNKWDIKTFTDISIKGCIFVK